MAILTMPSTPGIRRSAFGLISNTTVFRSPLDQVAHTLEFPGARWRASYALPLRQRAAIAAWQAFLVQLRGQAGRFYAYDPDARTPRGAGGSLAVAGAGQTGTALNVDGGAAATLVLKAGDLFAYDVTAGAGRQLHMVVSDATTGGGGAATLTIEPPIRISPADAEPLILTDPSCVMMLADPEVGWDADLAGYYGIEFEAVEVF